MPCCFKACTLRPIEWSEPCKKRTADRQRNQYFHGGHIRIRMNIAYLSHSPVAARVANAIHVMKMCAAFAAHGHQVTLYARGKPTPMPALRAAYGVASDFDIVLRRRGSIAGVSRALYAVRQAHHARRRQRADLYYARCTATARLALALGGATVLEVHQIPDKRSERAMLRAVLSHPRLARCVTISRGLLEDLHVVHPGLLERVDCVVAHDGASPAMAQHRFDLQRGSGRQFGYAGGLRRGNGLDTLLALAAALPGDTFHMLGGDAHEVAAWRARQRSANVVWHGRCEPAKVAGFLAACDVLLAPYVPGPMTTSGADTSRWMSPLKIFEYMASRTPMIVSDFPVLREVLTDDTAEWARPGDVDSWLAAVRRLTTTRGREIAERAGALLDRHYTWEARAERVLRGLKMPARRSARNAQAGRYAERHASIDNP